MKPSEKKIEVEEKKTMEKMDEKNEEYLQHIKEVRKADTVVLDRKSIFNFHCGKAMRIVLVGKNVSGCDKHMLYDFNHGVEFLCTICGYHKPEFTESEIKEETNK